MTIPTNPMTKFLASFLLVSTFFYFFSCNNPVNNSKEKNKKEGIDLTFLFLEAIEQDNKAKAKSFISERGLKVNPVDKYIDIIDGMIEEHGFPPKEKEFVDTSLNGPDLHVTVYFDKPKEGWVRPDVHVRYKNFDRSFKIDFLTTTTGGKKIDFSD